MAAAAAAAQPMGQPVEGDPAAEGMMPEPDPIEQDNQQLSNILQNLELRTQVVEAQKALEELTAPKKGRRSFKDPDKPRKGPPSGQNPDLSTSSTLEAILRNTPRMRRPEAATSAPKEKAPKDSTKNVGVIPSGGGANDRSVDEPLPDGTQNS